MKKLSDQQIRRMFSEARRMASVALNDTPGGLPDRSELNEVACAFIAAGFVDPNGKPARGIDRAGVDRDQDDALASAYDDRN